MTVAATAACARASALSAVERAIGAPLPDDYRTFLVIAEEVTMRATCLLASELPGQVVTIDRLFSLAGDGTNAPLLREHEEIVAAASTDEGGEDMPPRRLAIGQDPGGNVFLLSLDPREPGVFYWDYARAHGGRREERQVASTFADLWSRLMVYVLVDRISLDAEGISLWSGDELAFGLALADGPGTLLMTTIGKALAVAQRTAQFPPDKVAVFGSKVFLRLEGAVAVALGCPARVVIEIDVEEVDGMAVHQGLARLLGERFLVDTSWMTPPSWRHD